MAVSGLIMIASLMLLLLPNKLHSQSSSDFTDFNFNNFVGNEADLIYQGDAHIPTDPDDRPPGVEEGQSFVSLTNAYFFPDTPDLPAAIPFDNSVGRVVYSPPIRLWDAAGRRQASFQTVIRGYIGNSLTIWN
ncbi:hypothetical protein ACS0TY_024157 [Phlomoides rotata]